MTRIRFRYTIGGYGVCEKGTLTAKSRSDALGAVSLLLQPGQFVEELCIDWREE